MHVQISMFSLATLFWPLSLFSLAMQEIFSNQCPCCSILHRILFQNSVRLLSWVNLFTQPVSMFSGLGHVKHWDKSRVVSTDPQSTPCPIFHFVQNPQKNINCCLKSKMSNCQLSISKNDAKNSLIHCTGPLYRVPWLFLVLSVSSFHPFSLICLDFLNVSPNCLSFPLSKYQNN